MDLATIIGFLIASGGIIFAMYEGTHGEFMTFFSEEGFILVMGGAIGLAIMSMPFHAVKGLPLYLKKCILHKEVHASHLIEQIVQFAEIARRDGVLALENSVKTTDDPFMKKGLQLAIDGADPAVIEQVMSIELSAIEERHHHGKKMFELMGKYGPALGLTATLVGQVVMFKNMAGGGGGGHEGGGHEGGGGEGGHEAGGGDQASKIAKALQVALLGTLYGTVWANLICGPLFDKLSVRSKEELFLKQIIIQGILSIQAGDNPRIVESKLLSFLSAKERAHMAPSGGGAKEK